MVIGSAGFRTGDCNLVKGKTGIAPSSTYPYFIHFPLRGWASEHLCCMYRYNEKLMWPQQRSYRTASSGIDHKESIRQKLIPSHPQFHIVLNSAMQFRVIKHMHRDLVLNLCNGVLSCGRNIDILQIHVQSECFCS